ncbi:CDGSH iron-sulfur domain-containing protein [Kroppenstedtia eburnea]|uniref:Zn-finger domain of CDGSH type-containing protein n=2 Tax=Kroppenstedtia eburnea TaxID=714067 RepID=A0A1N7IS74_9BACL|nr:CDGSH iron-sulfur domain-containing protein [Kroppenstedtia eburnea]EGK13840.1 hypothetical protein HMPREF9374_0586 [Desmospora sp. 8437]QKI82146.1 CDGSH iron-sulfur domain-containing protein [Kroppenstedtia eburnea]SIS39938.1 Zn-finger domain of CDGSH type-containing protein [Kroppenstedtia eburnea]
MARVVIKEAKGPYTLQEGDKKKICMCGLSDNQPFCNGNHGKTKDEEEAHLYHYEGDSRKEVRIEETTGVTG